MRPRYSTASVVGRRQTDDTPLTDGPIIVGKADWKNITEHQRRGRNARRQVNAGKTVAGIGGAIASGAMGASIGAGRRPVQTLHEARHIVRMARGKGMSQFAGSKMSHAKEAARETGREAMKYPEGALIAGGGATAGVGGGLYVTGKIRERHHDNAIARQRKSKVTKDESSQPSSGRLALGTLVPGLHSAIAGKKKHKLRAFGNEWGGSMAGSLPGTALSVAGARTGKPALAAAGNALAWGGAIGGASAGTRRAHRMGHLKPDKGNVTKSFVSAKAIARLRGTGMNPMPQFQQGPGAKALQHKFHAEQRPDLARRAGNVLLARSDRAAYAEGRVKNEFQPKLSSYQSSGVGKGLRSVLRGTKKVVPLPEPHIPAFAVKGGWRDARLDAREYAASDRGRFIAGRVGKSEVSKTRNYDPEHRRQRRLGMGQAALLMGGGTSAGFGVKGAMKDTETVRRGVSGGKNLKRLVAASPRNLALLGGGIAGVGGAGAIQQHANSRRGKGWD